MENIIGNKANLQKNTQGNPSVSGTMPLSLVGVGTDALVSKINGKDDAKRFLRSLGFVEGTKIEVLSAQDGNLIIKVKGARIAISKSMAARVHAQIA